MSELAFSYQAQTAAGQTLSGTLHAADLDAARSALNSMNLRIITLALQGATAPRPKPLRGDDFQAFNQQLAHLTATGLPVEQGLRLIAHDMRSGRLSATVNAIADDLDRGIPLAQAFERHRTSFPALYGRLLDAGVKTNNLSAMLFNMGRHLELVAKIRATLWRTAAYPLMVISGMILVMLLISIYVLPQFRAIFNDFSARLPALTEFFLIVGDNAIYIALGIAILVVAIPTVWFLLYLTNYQRYVRDYAFLPIPVLGTALRANLLARWCDALRLAVSADLDLPNALALASDSVASPRLTKESTRLIGLLQAGQTLETYRGTFILPLSVTTTIHLATQQRDLPQALATLSDMYQQQAEHRINLLPAILTPLLLLFAAVLLSVSIVALFFPLIRLIQSITSF